MSKSVNLDNFFRGGAIVENVAPLVVMAKKQKTKKDSAVKFQSAKPIVQPEMLREKKQEKIPTVIKINKFEEQLPQSSNKRGVVISDPNDGEIQDGSYTVSVGNETPESRRQEKLLTSKKLANVFKELYQKYKSSISIESDLRTELGPELYNDLIAHTNIRNMDMMKEDFITKLIPYMNTTGNIAIYSPLFQSFYMYLQVHDNWYKSSSKQIFVIENLQKVRDFMNSNFNDPSTTFLTTNEWNRNEHIYISTNNIDFMYFNYSFYYTQFYEKFFDLVHMLNNMKRNFKNRTYRVALLSPINLTSSFATFISGIGIKEFQAVINEVLHVSNLSEQDYADLYNYMANKPVSVVHIAPTVVNVDTAVKPEAQDDNYEGEFTRRHTEPEQGYDEGEQEQGYDEGEQEQGYDDKDRYLYEDIGIDEYGNHMNDEGEQEQGQEQGQGQEEGQERQEEYRQGEEDEGPLPPPKYSRFNRSTDANKYSTTQKHIENALGTFSDAIQKISALKIGRLAIIETMNDNITNLMDKREYFKDNTIKLEGRNFPKFLKLNMQIVDCSLRFAYYIVKIFEEYKKARVKIPPKQRKVMSDDDFNIFVQSRANISNQVEILFKEYERLGDEYERMVQTFNFADYEQQQPIYPFGDDEQQQQQQPEQQQQQQQQPGEEEEEAYNAENKHQQERSDTDARFKRLSKLEPEQNYTIRKGSRGSEAVEVKDWVVLMKTNAITKEDEVDGEYGAIPQQVHALHLTREGRKQVVWRLKGGTDVTRKCYAIVDLLPSHPEHPEYKPQLSAEMVEGATGQGFRQTRLLKKKLPLLLGTRVVKGGAISNIKMAVYYDMLKITSFTYIGLCDGNYQYILDI
jgi:uncharacterized protein YsxB (DUF464 family)